MSKLRNEGPIGVFDSGLGGFTVLRALAEHLPREDLVYFGDNARVPYGIRSEQTVINYARACAGILRSLHIKALVVACNTVSAVALDVLRAELFFPVLGVIEPGTRAGLAQCPNGRLGVLATGATVRSGAYPRAALSCNPDASIFVRAAPLLVPLVEEDVLSGELARLCVRKYLEPLVLDDIDALLLGCTHYPLLTPLMASELVALSGKNLPIIDSAEAVTAELLQLMASQHLATERAYPGKLRIILTDRPDNLDLASRWLGRDPAELNVTTVDL
jgi:glutamate racemase